MRAFLALAALMAPGALCAQSYTGTYVTPNDGGGSVTLSLSEQGQGRVSGSMASNGAAFTIEAVRSEGSVLGTMTGDGVGMYFAAEFDEGRLMVTLYEAGPDNQPDYSSGQTFAFTRQDGAFGGAPAPPPMPRPRTPPKPSIPAPAPAPPAPAPSSPMPPRAGQGTGEPAQAGNGALPAWNMRYGVPANWQVQRTVGRLQVLGSTSEPGALFVAPGLYSNFNEVAADLSVFYQSLGLQASPVEPPRTTTVGGMQAMSATYASYDQMGQVVHGRVVALISQYGTGFVVLGMTTPQMMQRLGQTVDRVAQSVRIAGPPRVNQQLVAALRGRWMLYSGRSSPTTSVSGGAHRSYEEIVEFDGQGRFTFQSSASVSVYTPGFSGGAGGANANNDQGTYTVIGNTLVVRGQAGQMAYDIQLSGNQLIAGGKTYARMN